MDTDRVTLLLDQVMKRLDQTENQQFQLDHVMARLDTLQNTIESQNKKHNMLHEKMSEMTTKLEQEKMFMRDQLRGAQNEILVLLREQADAAVPVITSSVPNSGQVQQQNTHSQQDWNDAIGELRDKLETLDQKTDFMKTQIIDTAQKCKTLITSTSKLETLLEDNIKGIIDHERVNLKTALAEIHSIPDIVKEQTMADLVWLSDQIGVSISDGDTTVNHNLDLLKEKISEQVKQNELIIDTLVLDKQKGLICDKLDKQQEYFNNVLDKHQGHVYNLLANQNQTIVDLKMKIDKVSKSTQDIEIQLDKSVDTILAQNANMGEHFSIKCKEEEIQLIQDISGLFVPQLDDVKTEIQKCFGTWKMFKEELELNNTSINSLAGNLDTIEKNIAVAIEKIKKLAISLKIGHRTARTDHLALKQEHDQMATRIEQSTKDVKEAIHKSKREIFAVTEKEAQIVRDRIRGPLPSHRIYTFDFFVENFKTSIKSGHYVESLPWHINEMSSCVKGSVIFSLNGEMAVGLLYGRHPREVGLQPTSGIKLRVKVSICDTYKKTLPALTVGERTVKVDEADICGNLGGGCGIVVASCNELTQKGYGEKEGYLSGAVLIRYDVTVL